VYCLSDGRRLSIHEPAIDRPTLVPSSSVKDATAGAALWRAPGGPYLYSGDGPRGWATPLQLSAGRNHMLVPERFRAVAGTQSKVAISVVSDVFLEEYRKRPLELSRGRRRDVCQNRRRWDSLLGPPASPVAVQALLGGGRPGGRLPTRVCHHATAPRRTLRRRFESAASTSARASCIRGDGVPPPDPGVLNRLHQTAREISRCH